MDWVEIGVWASLIGSIVILVYLVARVVKLMKTTHSED